MHHRGASVEELSLGHLELQFAPEPYAGWLGQLMMTLPRLKRADILIDQTCFEYTLSRGDIFGLACCQHLQSLQICLFQALSEAYEALNALTVVTQLTHLSIQLDGTAFEDGCIPQGLSKLASLQSFAFYNPDHLSTPSRVQSALQGLTDLTSLAYGKKDAGLPDNIDDLRQLQLLEVYFTEGAMALADQGVLPLSLPSLTWLSITAAGELLPTNGVKAYTCISCLASLKILQLDFHGVSHDWRAQELQSVLSPLIKLEALSLNSMGLSELPVCIQSMHLRALDLYMNELCHLELGSSMQTIELLDIDKNIFSAVPACLASCKRLQHVSGTTHSRPLSGKSSWDMMVQGPQLPWMIARITASVRMSYFGESLFD